MTTEFKQLDPLTRYTAWLIVLFAGLVTYDQYFYWSTLEDYSFGFLVPLFAAYVVYDRWPKLGAYLAGTQEEVPQGKSSSVAEKFFGICFGLGLLASLVVFAAGALIRAGQGPSNQGSIAIAAGFGGIVMGFAYLNSEFDVTGRAYGLAQRLKFTMAFLFPALVWLISAPMVMYMYSDVKIVLLEWVTIIVYHTFNFLGFTLVREGNILVMPHGSVGVADACSGIRSLTACIFAGSFLAAVFLDRFWKKCLLLIVASFLAFFMNILRSVFLTAWAYKYGPHAIDEKVAMINMSVHDIAGYSVLILTVIVLLALLPIFTMTLTFDDEDDDEEFFDEDYNGDDRPPSTVTEGSSS
ncbi:MAG: exosortase/archaeosortase family protein [Verrucomicrobiota bacterium]